MTPFNPIIFVPFAYVPDAKSGVNITATGKSCINLYLKNATVALFSAKYYNPACTVALVTNLDSQDIPVSFRILFEKQNIQIIQIPFDRFIFGRNYPWFVAFFKLCALSYMVEREFTHFCFLDTDVYIQHSFDAIWKESEHFILLYDINHGLNTLHYQQIIEEFQSFLHTSAFPTHFGGEFFASSKYLTNKFLEQAQIIYQQMKKTNFRTTKGDEFITSLVAWKLKLFVKNAGAYVFRFWSGWNFHLTSTCYKYNPVIVLHLPCEKERGMLKLYSQYISRNRFPTSDKVHKICRLSYIPLIDKVMRLMDSAMHYLHLERFFERLKKTVKIILLSRRNR